MRITQQADPSAARGDRPCAPGNPERSDRFGLSTGELGLRLRYEIVPQFPPYVGVNYERALRRYTGGTGGWTATTLGAGA